MSFTQNPRSPGDVRTVMQTMYDAYTSGIDRFPRVRFDGSPDVFPRKTQQIAKLLFEEWDIIKEDRDFFDGAVISNVNAVFSQEAAGTRRLVITRIGRNAVAYADILGGEPPHVQVGEFDIDEFNKSFEGLDINLADGRTLTLQDGKMVGDFDAGIVRQSNLAVVMDARPSRTVEGVETNLV